MANRRSPAKLGEEEWLEFLGDYSLESSISDSNFKLKFRNIYKRYHPILIWNSFLSNHKPEHFTDDNHYINFSIYFKELTSDVCQALFLWSQGVYKPCNLILRSGLENFIKCLGLYDNNPVLEIKSVYDLYNFVRRLDVVQNHKELNKLFDHSHQLYIKLCAYTHTKDTLYMTLSTAVGVFPQYNKRNAEEFKDDFYCVAKAVNCYMSVLFYKELRGMHHQDFDCIMDVLPAKIKRLI